MRHLLFCLGVAVAEAVSNEQGGGRGRAGGGRGKNAHALHCIMVQNFDCEPVGDSKDAKRPCERLQSLLGRSPLGGALLLGFPGGRPLAATDTLPLSMEGKPQVPR